MSETVTFSWPAADPTPNSYITKLSCTRLGNILHTSASNQTSFNLGSFEIGDKIHQETRAIYDSGPVTIIGKDIWVGEVAAPTNLRVTFSLSQLYITVQNITKNPTQLTNPDFQGTIGGKYGPLTLFSPGVWTGVGATTPDDNGSAGLTLQIQAGDPGQYAFTIRYTIEGTYAFGADYTAFGNQADNTVLPEPGSNPELWPPSYGGSGHISL